MILDKKQVLVNISKVQELLKAKNMDNLYISSFDIFLNEYVPLQDCLRFYLSGFNGSVAHLLIPKAGKVKLYVDGRYHEQADKQVGLEHVEVVKVPYGESIEDALLGDINISQNLGMINSRTALSLYFEFKKKVECLSVSEQAVLESIGHERLPEQGGLESLPIDLSGVTTSSKLNDINENGHGHWIGALDSLAWLCNLRGYQLPFQSTVKAKALATKQKVYLFTDENNLKLKNSLSKRTELEWFSYEEMPTIFKKLNLEIVQFQPSSTNVADYLELSNHFKLQERPLGLYAFQKMKNLCEVKVFENSFEKSDQVIWKTLQWIKNEAKSRKVSESEYYLKTAQHYNEAGAKGQSFNTIAGFGANSSVIHYGASSDQIFIQEGQLALLDSGAFYEGGLATDCTRTVLPLGKATNQQKLQYTTVLRSILHCQNHQFKPGTIGKDLDHIARNVIEDAGFHYAHGTGHGVGVNVHEAGYSITPRSETPMLESLVGSIEPGIYIPNEGGIRLENVAVVEQISANLLGFRSFVHIGFEIDLIDQNLMDEQELNWWKAYEFECQKRGRSLLNSL